MASIAYLENLASSWSISCSIQAGSMNASAFAAPFCLWPERGLVNRGRRVTSKAFTLCLDAPSSTARTRLLELVGAAYSLRSDAADEALSHLIDSAPLSADEARWESAVDGRWGLRYSTEPPLASLLEDGVPLLGVGKQSYQLFRDGGDLVENIVEFPNAVLGVGAKYTPRTSMRAFDFRFRTTRLLLGKNAAQYRANGDNSDTSTSTGFGLDLTFPFAVGAGLVELVWLDHALRVDKSTLGGEEVLNVYVYEGPVEKCTVSKRGW